MPNHNKSQLQELLSNLVDEKLGEQELKELQALLRDDPDAQQFYVRYTMLHSWLTWDYVEQTSAESRLLSLNKQEDSDKSANPSPILGFLGDCANFLNHYSPLSFILLFVMFGITILATSYWLAPAFGQDVGGVGFRSPNHGRKRLPMVDINTAADRIDAIAGRPAIGARKRNCSNYIFQRGRGDAGRAGFLYGGFAKVRFS